ncbi:uncharacterized protein LOC106875504 [Octopus bimaculoides]|uniref:uncharacterized protein LOC106875504 n=1 Tax=Octopus bimaculoides TaxID=37653 RepID=UPI00071C9DA7|nr:uncharacterized protein LOC106875504 [Octopus bimaculoides]|eukprot:XP_014779165.1 PREDICTED: uncharacterized protein LOC106875504 [Octopus bimaculoides]
MAYLTRKRGQTLTTKLDEQIKAEHDFWKRVLQQVMTVIYLLRERGLAFRNDETFCCPNNGNFLGLLELIAKFDPFLRTHINQYENEGHTSYLSKTICEEVIQLMAKIVLEEIVKEIKEAGYFSVSVDSTLDVSNVDQLTVIVRHVSSLDGIPVERFLTFIELKNHTGEEMVELIPNFFEELEIDFRNCRGQSYNNAANMAGNIWENFDEIEEQAKTTLPDVEYRSLQRRRRKRQHSDGSATKALDEILPMDNFRIYSFIPITDTLHSNLDRRAIVYMNEYC